MVLYNLTNSLYAMHTYASKFCNAKESSIPCCPVKWHETVKVPAPCKFGAFLTILKKGYFHSKVFKPFT